MKRGKNAEKIIIITKKCDLHLDFRAKVGYNIGI